jgi:hypothetical protein
MNHRLLFILVFAINLCVACFAAYADQTDRFKKYVDPTMKQFTDYAFDAGLIKLQKTEDVLGLVEYKDCTLYEAIKDNMFKQQQMLELLNEGQKHRLTTFNKEFNIRVDDILFVSKYNFSTQSIDLLPQSTLKTVGVMGLLRLSDLPCSSRSPKIYKFIPTNYAIKLNFPVSLLRIPMQPDTAEDIIKKLDKAEKPKNMKILYIRLYFTVEGILPEMERRMRTGNRAMLLGQIDAIDIFTDAERTKRIKRLDYSAAY